MHKIGIKKKYTLILAIVLAAALLKLGLVLANTVPFNADEAVVALMARHILQGERPVFFYGQAYMGSLDAYLIAAGFWLFGAQVWVIRLVQGLLYIGILLTTFWLGNTAFRDERIGVLAAGILAIPPVNTTLYTTASLGGYGEALLIGNLIVIAGLRIANILIQKPQKNNTKNITNPHLFIQLALLGFWDGLGLWAFGLTLVYSLPTTLYIVWLISRNWNSFPRSHWAFASICIFFGFLVGSLPWWGYAYTHGFTSLLGELTGSAVAVEHTALFTRIINHAASLLLFGIPALLGLRPPWDVTWLALPLIPFILIIWGYVISYIVRRLKVRDDFHPFIVLIVGVIITLICGFVFTSFGVDPSGRYFLPLMVPLALAFVSAFYSSKFSNHIWGWGIIAILVVFNLTGNLQSAWANPPGITTQFNAETRFDNSQTQKLIDFLLSTGETRGYTNYWVGYPIAFLSNEQLIYIPNLPYHKDLRYTPRDDRYAPYHTIVDAAQKIAYITLDQPNLQANIRNSLSQLNIQWEEKKIGDYFIFYQLSKPVSPDELDLGVVLK